MGGRGAGGEGGRHRRAGPVAAQPAARANRRTRDQYASNLHSKNKQTTNVTTKNLVATHKQRAL